MTFYRCFLWIPAARYANRRGVNIRRGIRNVFPQKATEGVGTHSRNVTIAVLTGMVFLGAVLLFGMEPLVGRLLIPYFGGAAHVWLTCLMFFQAMLLVGYLYAHLFARKFGVWHLLLLPIPLVNLPLRIYAAPDPHAPLLDVLMNLLLHAALPFVVLSTTAVVAQSWLSRSPLGRRYDPYPLYAASNAGSLIALLGYTFLAEPLMGLRTQSLIWTGGYIAYMVLVAAAWFQLRPEKEPTILTSENPIKSGWNALRTSVCLRWILLSSLPSALLLTVTNFIALEVGSFPLTWVFPLALYLGSFIVTFRINGGVPGFLRALWPELLLGSFFLYLLGPSPWLAIIGHLIVFFMLCLVAHGSLYELRPPASHLTYFYLLISLGGWIGGAVVSLVAPFAFKGLFEYPILLGLVSLTFWWCCDKTLSVFRPGASRTATGLRIAVIAVMICLIGMESWASLKEPIMYRHRNFYGTYRIKDDRVSGGESAVLRKLLHGRTLHGAQILDPVLRFTPVSYYYPGGGISDAYETTPWPRKIAVLGLGSGAAAAYAKPEDMITYYEIDPDNERIARRWFTYLEDCKGKVDIIVGDGRLSMQRVDNGTAKYDIIHMDAFTGDGIPTHLLTREAMEIYLSRLAENGVILFHISNRYYELRPVIKATSRDLNLSGAINVPPTRDKLRAHENATWCVVLSRHPERLQPLLSRGWKLLGTNDGMNEAASWSDDYINILAPLMENLKMNIAEYKRSLMER
jgi:hypothetical protein